jgi:DNA-binding LacI/PurR family transcriptional regulator
VLGTLLDRRITAAFVEERADAVALAEAAAEHGVDIPGDLSVVALGDATRPAATGIDFSGFHVPRQEMGRQATELLEAVLSGHAAAGTQRLLPCELAEGTTLIAPKGL